MFLACATRLQLFSASSIPNFPLFASIILSAQTDGLCKHTYDGDDDNIWWLYLEWHIWYDDVDDYGSIFVSIIQCVHIVHVVHIVQCTIWCVVDAVVMVPFVIIMEQMIMMPI